MIMSGDAARILRFWQAIEIFSPQKLPWLEPPRRDAREHVVDIRPGEPMPWEPAWRGDARLKQDHVWRHQVFGGVYELRAARDALVQRYGQDNDPDDERNEPVSGHSSLFACTVDADGMLLEGSAVLSACAWATGRAVNSHGPAKTWLNGFEEDANNYGDELGKLAGSRLAVGAACWLPVWAPRCRPPGQTG
jgi:hypothetical protein